MAMAASRSAVPANLRDRIRAAEKPSLLRARRIEHLNGQDDEKLAINNAFKSLRRLKSLSEWL
jgi:hypothetical protein